MSICFDILRSWSDTKGTVETMESILDWIEDRKKTLSVSIVKKDFPAASFDFSAESGNGEQADPPGYWFYDKTDGVIRNKNNSFFNIAGFRELEGGEIICEQPVILQPEIGYLGIICKKIGGVLNFLMQAKIEPGNINHIQISPTIQATKSNFTQKHGGAAPAYLDWFKNSSEHTILVDQVQSEQSSRFFRKRNRNIMILIGEDEEIEVLPSHKWMTLGQIKELMKIDNAVNMDTRTVLSCMQFAEELMTPEEHSMAEELFSDKALFRSMFASDNADTVHRIFNRINDRKMFAESEIDFVPLHELASWKFEKNEIACRTPYDFKVIYCDIEIEGREVRKWEQPLVEACGELLIGLFTRVKDGKREFLVCIRHEIGCFDTVELSPSIQLEPSNTGNELNSIEQAFIDRLEEGKGVMKDVFLSEEGGRFYHEQNRNVIIDITEDPPISEENLDENYFWTDYRTLDRIVQFNNYLNIQLRNLLSILSM